MRKSPTIQAVKALFAASGGICAFPDCGTRLVESASGVVLGDVCHIHAVGKSGPRHDPGMTIAQCNGVSNLIALCPTHHRLIDSRAGEYPAALLREIKKSHETAVALQVDTERPPIQDRAVIDLARQLQVEGVDFALIVALPLEMDALLRSFPELQKVVLSGRARRTYYTGSVATSHGFQYRIVASLLRGMGNLEAANATHDIIIDWNPRYIIVCGIAGGLRPRVQEYGDVIIAETVVYYELGKETLNGHESRNRHFPCDPSLLDAARNMRAADWRELLPTRPDDQSRSTEFPSVHFGPLASGEKVVASSEVRDRLLNYQPDLVGVEMESAGVASAALGAVRKIGFLAVRAICDFADQRKDDSWQGYAADTAANFLRSYLKLQPVGPSSGRWPRQIASLAKPVREDMLAKRKHLFGKLCRQLDMEEMKDLCFLLGVDVDELPADRKSSRARELILLFERRGKLNEVASALENMLNDDYGIGEQAHEEKRVIMNTSGTEASRSPLRIVFDEAHGQKGWYAKPCLEFDYSVAGSLASDHREVMAHAQGEFSETLLSSWDVLVLPMPYGTLLSKSECQAIEEWVYRGGGLLLCAFYFMEAHLYTNFNTLAAMMDIQFSEDLILPAGQDSRDDILGQAFPVSDEYCIRTAPRCDVADHPLLDGVTQIALQSSCSLETLCPDPELKVTTDVAVTLVIPRGRRPNGPKTKILQITDYDRRLSEHPRFLAAIIHGSGRVVAVGTWKLFVNHYMRDRHCDNRKLFDNAVRWLVG